MLDAALGYARLGLPVDPDQALRLQEVSLLAQPEPPEPAPALNGDRGPQPLAPYPPVSTSDPAILNLAPGLSDEVGPGDRSVLIVEDDPAFARILLDAAHDKGFKGLVATRGMDALTAVHHIRPEAMPYWAWPKKSCNPCCASGE